MTTATQAPRFRKSKTGTWVVFGPASIVMPGSVEVAKADGSTRTVTIVSVGKSFRADGVVCVYGYEAEKTERPAGRTYGGYRQHRSAYGSDNCWKCAKFGNFDGCDRCGADGDC